jgi:hypothetical protein
MSDKADRLRAKLEQVRWRDLQIARRCSLKTLLIPAQMQPPPRGRETQTGDRQTG